LKGRYNVTLKGRYNVTLKRVRATIVPVEKKQLLHILGICVCSFSHLACNAHATFCHLRTAWLCNVCPLCLINGKIFEKKKIPWT